MSAATTSMQALSHRYSEKVRRHKDGSVLLSITDDRICKLNNVGAITWMVFQEADTALKIDEVVCRLEEQFQLINAEGEYSYEVTSEQLRADTASFLSKLIGMNLLEQVENAAGQIAYRIGENVSATTSNSTAETVSCSRAADSAAGALHVAPVLKREILSAFLGLLAFDLLLKLGGFSALIERVHRWPIAKPSAADPEIYRHVRAMVDRAQMYYLKKAMCLQHSAVVTCLLRRRGVPAEMVLAAREFPIRVHAWSEVAGYVVNDQQSVKTRHREMRRV